MVKKNLFLSVLLFLLFINYGCNDNKSFFYFPEDYPRIVSPVMINDSIKTNLIFDTGGWLLLDSAFCSKNNIIPEESYNSIFRTGWTAQTQNGMVVKAPIHFSLGKQDVKFDYFLCSDYVSYFGFEDPCNFYNIPQNDTLNVWEINFEKNFIQLHRQADFRSKGIHFFPLERKNGNFYINVPIAIRFRDGTSIVRTLKCLIDTGTHRDIVLANDDDICKDFEGRKDALWYCLGNSYYKMFETEALVFNKFTLKDVRVYSFPSSVSGIESDCVLGINFLKNFNVYFDLKEKRLGLRPVKNFHRIFTHHVRRYHFSSDYNGEGEPVIAHIAEYEGNFYKDAGLNVGDVLVSVNDVKWEELVAEHYYEVAILERFHNSGKNDFSEKNDFIIRPDTLNFTVRRGGQEITIPVVVDRHENQIN